MQNKIARGNTLMVFILLIVGVAVAWFNYGHMGCFDDPDNMFPRHHIYEDDQLTWSKCLNHCYVLGYFLAGATNGTVCFCSKNWRVLRSLTSVDGGCTTPCRGNENATCGGEEAMKISRLQSFTTVAHNFEVTEGRVPASKWLILRKTKTPLVECAWYCNDRLFCFTFVHDEVTGDCRGYDAMVAVAGMENGTVGTERVYQIHL